MNVCVLVLCLQLLHLFFEAACGWRKSDARLPREGEGEICAINPPRIRSDYIRVGDTKIQSLKTNV